MPECSVPLSHPVPWIIREKVKCTCICRCEQNARSVKVIGKNWSRVRDEGARLLGLHPDQVDGEIEKP